MRHMLRALGVARRRVSMGGGRTEDRPRYVDTSLLSLYNSMLSTTIPRGLIMKEDVEVASTTMGAWNATTVHTLESGHGRVAP